GEHVLLYHLLRPVPGGVHHPLPPGVDPDRAAGGGIRQLLPAHRFQADQRRHEPRAALPRDGADGLPARVRAGVRRADVRRDPRPVRLVQRRAVRGAGAVEVLTRPRPDGRTPPETRAPVATCLTVAPATDRPRGTSPGRRATAALVLILLAGAAVRLPLWY